MSAALSTGTEVWGWGSTLHVHCPHPIHQPTTHTAGESYNKEQDKEHSQKILSPQRILLTHKQPACRQNLND